MGDGFGIAGLQSGEIGNVVVGATSTEIFSSAETLQLELMVLTNDSDETIYVSLGGPAQMNKGIRLNADGGNFVLDGPSCPRGVPVHAICASGGKRLCTQVAA